MTEQQAYPKKIVSLLDVAYCKRNRIGLLTKESEHENLCKTIGYIPQIYRLRKLNSPFPKITGFETNYGILLFSNTNKGLALSADYLQYQADRFFKAQERDDLSANTQPASFTRNSLSADRPFC